VARTEQQRTPRSRGGGRHLYNLAQVVSIRVIKAADVLLALSQGQSVAAAAAAAALMKRRRGASGGRCVCQNVGARSHFALRRK
jgi:hypothetical protein